MSNVIIGIDNGVSGSLAAISSHNGAFIDAITMPIQKARKGNEIDVAEVERLKSEAELYSEWSKWKDGIWKISHPDFGPSAEWIADDIEKLEADKARLDWLEKRESMEGFTRDAIDAAMKGEL